MGSYTIPGDPSVQIIPILGPKVYKYYLLWAIWIPRDHGLAESGGDRAFNRDEERSRHYDESQVVGPAVLGEVGWYDITVQKIILGNQDWAL